jgi:hypothetical protein
MPSAVGEKRRLRASKALAASVALHVLCAAILLRFVSIRRSPASRPWQPPAQIEFSLTEPQLEERNSRQRPEAPPPVPRRAPAPPAPSRPARSVGGAIAQPPVPGTASGKPPEAARPIDLSFDALGDAAKQRAGRESADELERLLSPQPPPLPGKRAPADTRADAERSADATENVRAGRAHPLLFDYLRNARDLLTPEATRIAEGLPLGPKQTTKGWQRGYLGRVADANRHALADAPEAPDESVGGRRPDVLGAYNEAEHQAASGAEERTAEVCLGVAPGHPVVVTLRRSSTNAALDRLALDSFQSAGRTRPVAADARPGLACYLVRVSAFRMPPLPSLSFALGPHGRPEVIYPLKRITKVTVELQSVDYGPRHAPPSLLHAP